MLTKSSVDFADIEKAFMPTEKDLRKSMPPHYPFVVKESCLIIVSDGITPKTFVCKSGCPRFIRTERFNRNTFSGFGRA